MHGGLPAALLVFGAVLPAQETMSIGILRGSLIEWQGGSLSVRQANGAVYDCFYDNHTLFQRNERADSIDRLKWRRARGSPLRSVAWDPYLLRANAIGRLHIAEIAAAGSTAGCPAGN
jgi:hypothetical protein